MKSINPIFSAVSQFDWPTVDRQQWEQAVLANMPYDMIPTILTIQHSPFQFYFADGTMIYANTDARFTITDSPLPVHIEDMLTPDHLVGLELEEEPSPHTGCIFGAEDQDEEADVDYEISQVTYREAMRKLVSWNPTTHTLNTESKIAIKATDLSTGEAHYFLFGVADNNFIALARSIPEWKFHGVELDIGNNLDFLVSNTGADVNYDDAVIDFCYTVPAGTELSAYRSVFKPVGNWSYLSVAHALLMKAKSDGKKTVMTVETGEGLPTALSYNVQGTDWVHVNLPYRNIHQFENLGVPITAYAEAPDSFNLSEVAAFIADPKSPIDVYASAIFHLEKSIPFFRDMVTQLPNRFTMHSQEAIALETDRKLGKQVASDIGIPVKPWVYLDKKDYLKQWHGAYDNFGTKVAVKFNKRHFIGIFDKADVESNLSVWINMYPDDTVFVEDYITSANREINLCYMVSGAKVQPMMFLCEVNKLLSNDSGGKGGNTIAYHDTRIDTYGDMFGAITDALTRLHEHVKGVNGWLDLSFMVDDEGRPFFTEWCIRMGCSNNASIVRMLKTPFPELLQACWSGKPIKPTWSDERSVSVDVYTVPLSAGDDAVCQITDSLAESEPCSDFDPIDIAGHSMKDGYFVQSGVRYGTITGYGDTFALGYQNALAHAAKNSVTNAAHRELSATEVEHLFPFIRS